MVYPKTRKKPGPRHKPTDAEILAAAAKGLKLDKTGRHNPNGGLNKTILDEDLLRNIARLWCTYEEMAHIMHCHPETLVQEYVHIIDEERAKTKRSIRMAQLDAALNKGDIKMLIHLGKTMLGQKEISEITINNKSVKDNLVDEILKRVAIPAAEEDAFSAPPNEKDKNKLLS